MEGMFIPILLVGFGAFVVYRIASRSKALMIKSPIIGFFDLSGGEFSGLLDEDKSAIAPVFAQVSAESVGIPTCNVLFLYCRIEPDGRLQGSSLGLREMIRDSGASIVVVASENPGPPYIAAAKRTGYGNANLVMTLGRKGPIFTKFFSQLFGLMNQGKSMPIAWVKLAPQIPGQIPGQEHADCPDTIFACEVGQLKFS